MALISLAPTMQWYLEGTLEDVVLEHERDGDKDKVQQEHGEAEPLVHAPIEAGDR